MNFWGFKLSYKIKSDRLKLILYEFKFNPVDLKNNFEKFYLILMHRFITHEVYPSQQVDRNQTHTLKAI